VDRRFRFDYLMGLTLREVTIRYLHPFPPAGGLTIQQPAITPNGDDIQEMIVDEDIGFILIVEKEVNILLSLCLRCDCLQAIFHTLAQVGFARNNAFNKPGIIITGKGYPDVATRQLVNKLCNGLPERYYFIASH
jgi:meiotic recombination protein SPO11